VLKHRENYEILNPEDVGISSSSIILTARSGRAALKHHLDRLGYKLDKINLDEVYQRFLVMADQKKEISDADLQQLMGDGDEKNYDDKAIKVTLLQVVCGDPLRPMATVKLKINGDEKEASAAGNGPVNATINAIHEIIKDDIDLDEFSIQAMHGGSEDVSKVNMRVKYNGQSYYGFGYSTDIVSASVNAYVDALNKIY